MSKEGEIESIETPAASSLPEQQPTSDDDADDGPDPFAGMAKGNYTIPDDYVNPLLITEAPENMEDHPELVALSELKYEGKTPEEVAMMLKDEGNELFRLGGKSNVKAAWGCYSEALDQKLETPNPKLFAILHSNRAAVHLTLKNHGKAVEDANKAIDYDETNGKAHFRLIKALNALGRHKEVLEAVMAAQLGLASLGDDPKAKDALESITKIEAASQAVLEKEEARAKKEAAEKKESQAVINMLTKLGACPGTVNPYKTLFPDTAKPKLDKDGFAMPVVLLYDEYMQSDVLGQVSLNTPILDILRTVFGKRAPWDRTGAYTPNKLSVYAILNEVPRVKPQPGDADSKRSWARINFNEHTTLIDALRIQDFIITVYPVFHVWPTGSAFEKQHLAKELPQAKF